ncbi:MAG: T9SS type A sorting domain-containing protein [Bacteroidales bacterium]|nr:T9SS type A sorting domain-containing protein [Bacteroidales bacterium]
MRGFYTFRSGLNIQKLIISDITGKQLFEKITIKQNETIDLSNFENGIYIISIQTDKEIFTTKIVKE